MTVAELCKVLQKQDPSSEVLLVPDSSIPTDYHRVYWCENRDEFVVLVYGPPHTLAEYRDGV